jgi:hypothetical protein
VELLSDAEELAKEQTMRELMDLQTAEKDGEFRTFGSAPGAVGLLPVELGRGSEASFPLAVRALQKALLARGFSTGDPSGIFGRQTEAAVKNFQVIFSWILRRYSMVEREQWCTFDSALPLGFRALNVVGI